MKKIVLFLVAFFAFAQLSFAAININTATQEELESVSGIGPVKAKAIVDYRNQNGRFKSIDELDNVKGIGKGTLVKMRDQVTVTGPSTPNKSETKSESAKKDEAKESAKASDDKKGGKKSKADEKSDSATKSVAADKKDDAGKKSKSDDKKKDKKSMKEGNDSKDDKADKKTRNKS